MKRFVMVEKAVGETPLAAIHAWKKRNPTFKDVPASYAGRLDPMASGKLLILLGEECKRQEAYKRLDKQYEIEVVLDIGTDTGDALGIPTYSAICTNTNDLSKTLSTLLGPHEVPYPVFSSKPVSGKPLFLHALSGTLGDITIPTHVETIYTITKRKTKTLSATALEARVASLLNRAPKTTEPSKALGADFRIAAVRAGWKNTFAQAKERPFIVFSLTVTCASGTYMRTLASRVGAGYGTGAFALSIRRTKIGKFIPLFGRFGFFIPLL